MARSLARHHRSRQNDDDRILPLVNVVFLLLIFFMIAGLMAQPERFNLLPPQSATDAPDLQRDMTVEIAPDGQIAFGGRTTTLNALPLLLADMMASDPHARLRLKADGEAEAAQVIQLMAVMRDAGVTHIQLIARRTGE